jgi:hypothetical protein
MSGRDEGAQERRDARSHGEDYPESVDAETLEERYAAPRSPAPRPRPPRRTRTRGRAGGAAADRFGPDERG